MKKFVKICCACVVAFILTGCSMSGVDHGNEQIVELNIQSIEDVSDMTGAVEEESEQEVVENVIEEIPINTMEETVQMDWTGEKLSRAFVSIGEKMYFSQWEKDGQEAVLYEMNIGENCLRKSEVETIKNMEVQMMARDMDGHIHLLMRSTINTSEDMESIIREIDGDGNIVRDIDISHTIKNRFYLWNTFLVDHAGNYYIKDLDYMICLDKSGEKIWEMDNRAEGIKRSFAATIVEEKVYLAFQKEDINYIGEIDSKTGLLRAEYPLAELGSDDRILTMKAGTDSELLIYGGNSGIWTWNSNDGRMEHRAVMSESDVPYSEYIVLRSFLDDGRLLLVKNISEGDIHIGITHHYIPGGN